ncbi:retention module-containing protein [Aeromonas schubertii]|nr:retention module-containing protein [Aeromonas schubertii]QCG47739.1 retention module-containing protein [Aeromonas schubertii]
MRTQKIDTAVTVSAIEGKAWILQGNVQGREIQKGDLLKAGTTIQIDDQARLSFAAVQDAPAPQPNPDELPATAATAPTSQNPAGGNDVNALQQAILQGADPTQAFEATAAGGAPAAGGGIGGVDGGSGNGGFIVVDRTGDATLAEAGFDTTYSTTGTIEPTQTEATLLTNELADADESVTVIEGGSVDGNVLANTTNPDGPADASVVSYSWGINENVPPGVASTLTGIGTLILNPDGSFTFTPEPNYDGAVPSVTYVVFDGQDEVTSTLNIAITVVDSPVELSGLDLAQGEVTVSDANVPEGSSPNPAALTQSGIFTFSALDGVQTLSVGGVSLITAGVAVATPVVIPSGLGNSLTVTAISFDPATGAGSVSYSYTLLDNENHVQPGNDTSLGESFAVVLVDEDGDSTNGSLDVTVLDDVPQAVNDGPFTVVEDAPSNVVSGSVLTNDLHGNGQVGADGRSFDGWLTSDPGVLAQYGTLQLNADGSYSFTLDNSLAATQALNPGEVKSMSFDYRIVDSDGDTSSATLTIRVEGSDDGVSLSGLDGQGSEVTVSDANLADGSAANGALLTQSGVFSFNAPDGVQTLSVGGVSLITAGVAVATPVVIPSGLGNSLTVTAISFDPATGAGSVSYSYTLLDNENHVQPGNDTSLGESFAVVLVDEDGDSTNGSLDVTVLDDVPQAVNDGPFTVVEDALSNVVSGSVLTNDLHGNGQVGADGRSFDGWLTSDPGVLAQYGTLQLNADGSYSFTLDNSLAATQALNPGEVKSMSFDYRIVDSDGDTSSATLTIRVEGSDDGVSLSGLDGQGSEVTVSDANLADGSAANGALLTQSGVFSFNAPDGVQTLSVGGVSLITAGVAVATPVVIPSGLGNSLTVTAISFDPATGAGSVSYSYTLLDNENHVQPGNDTSLGESFAVVLVDEDGDSTNGSLDVTVLDDVPQAVNDGPFTVVEDALSNVVSGSVLTNDLHGNGQVGADGRSFDGWLTSDPGVLAQYGTLQLNADGSYSFTLDNSLAATQALNPGEVKSMSFDYRIVDSDGDTSSATLTIRVEGSDDGVSLSGLDGQGSEVTVSDANLADGSAANGALLTQSGVFSFNAPDGVQTLSVGGVSLITAGVAVATPVVIPSGLGNSLTVTAISFDPATGAGSVSYSYTLLDNENHVQPGNDTSLGESFAVVLVDEDGDSTNGSLDVTVLDDVPQAVNDGPFTVVEDALSNVVSGSVLTNDLHGNGQVGADGRSFDGWLTSDPGVLAQYGTLQLNADGSYSFTLDNSLAATQALNPGEVKSMSFDYRIVDSDGDTSSATLTIRVEGSDDGVSLSGLDGQGSEVTVSDANLADGSAANGALLTQSGVFSFNAPDGVQTLSVGGVSLITAGVAVATPVVIPSGLGNSLTVTAISFDPATGAGSVSYSYTLLDNENHVQPGNDTSLGESFAVVLVDEDGDSTNGSLDVTVLDDVPQAVNDGPFTVVEDAPSNVVSGSVLTNDLHGNGQVGADGRSFDGWLTSDPGVLAQYGTLQLNADGSYSFTLDNSLAATQALNPGEVKSMSFDYRIVDSDGDTSSATLTIRVEGSDDGVSLSGLDGQGSEVTVSDANLADGSAANGALLTQSGVFSFNAPDGVQTLSVGGVSLITAGVAVATPVVIPSGLGNSLTVTAISFDPATGAGSVSYSYTLLDNENHVQPGNDTSLGESFAVVLVDEDGDSTNGSLDVTVLDDVPGVGSNALVQLDDDALAGGNAGGVGDDADAANVSGTLSHSFGADGAGSIAWLTSGAPAGFSYELSGSSLLVKQGVVTVLTVTVNSATGAYSVTQNAPIQHAAGSDENNAVFNLTYRVTDADSDTADGVLTINVDDDTPTVIRPDTAVMMNAAGSASFLLDLDGSVVNNYGADGATLRFSSALNGVNSGLTSGGLPITYALSVDGLTLTGSTGAGTVFTVVLNPANGTYAVNMVGSVDGGHTSVDFSNVGYDFVGGNTAWAGFVTAANDDSKDLLLTPMGDGTVNTTATTGGIGGGASVGSGEAMRVDFVIDLAGSPSSGGSGYLDSSTHNHSFDGHYDVNGGSALFTAIKGAGSTVKVIARQDSDSSSSVDNVIGDGVMESLTAIAIAYGGATRIVSLAAGLTQTVSVGGHSFTVSFVDGDPGPGVTYVATVAGVVDNTRLSAYTADGYNSLEFHYASGSDFKIGDFGVSVPTPGVPVNVDLGVTLTDGDGDTANSSLNINLMPDAPFTVDMHAAASDTVITLGGSQLDAIGSAHNDTITGNSLDNILFGGMATISSVVWAVLTS